MISPGSELLLFSILSGLWVLFRCHDLSGTFKTSATVYEELAALNRAARDPKKDVPSIDDANQKGTRVMVSSSEELLFLRNILLVSLILQAVLMANLC